MVHRVNQITPICSITYSVGVDLHPVFNEGRVAICEWRGYIRSALGQLGQAASRICGDQLIETQHDHPSFSNARSQRERAEWGRGYFYPVILYECTVCFDSFASLMGLWQCSAYIDVFQLRSGKSAFHVLNYTLKQFFLYGKM